MKIHEPPLVQLGTPLPSQLDHVPDIRLIACDMDGTLLDDEDAIHDDFWPLVTELKRRGILFCPASGRQYFSLLNRFGPIADDMIFIADNGAYVVQNGLELSSDCLTEPAVHDLLAIGESLVEKTPTIGIVACGKASAYMASSSPVLHASVGKSCHRLEVVDDLREVDDVIFKISLFTPDSSEHSIYPAFRHLQGQLEVLVSGERWLDIMAAGINKGSGVRHVQEKLGITRAQTMVFGDFVNDIAMMDEADYSFAMANAHPLLKARARYRSPKNSCNGVVRTIKSVLGID